jgi:hypothetical protein
VSRPAAPGAALGAALGSAVRVEQQAVYAYGVVAAHQDRADRRTALRRLAEHESRRDGWAALLHAMGVSPPAGAPAYALPFAVTDRATAAALAVRVESAVAGAAWDLVAASPPGSPARSGAVRALADAATWLLHWQRAGGAATPPVALPGAPG